MNDKYLKMATPPENALKPIVGGNLKGKSDINPQWRIEVMTETYGPCGIGWKYEIKSTREVPCPDGRIILFMGIELSVRENDEWSAPIPAYGGDFIIDLAKGQLVPNDEAYKMALTDALGSAMRVLGVAADVYRGLKDGKYNSRDARYNNVSDEKPVAKPATAPKQAANQTQPKPAAESLAWTKKHEGKSCVLVQGRYYYLVNLKKEQLKVIIENDNYKDVHEEAKKLFEAA